MKPTLKSRISSSLFALPYTLCFAAFLLFPICYGFYISLHDFELLSKEHPFVGLSNYIAIFTPNSYENALFFAGYGPRFSLLYSRCRCLLSQG